MTINNVQPGSIYVNSGGTLGVDASGYAPALTIFKPIVMAGGILESGMSAQGTTILGTGIFLNTPATFAPQGNSILTLTGPIFDGAAPNGIALAGSPGCRLVLNGANTFSGSTLIIGGTLTLGNSLALQASTLDSSGSGSFSFGSLTAAKLGGLTGPGAISLANSSAIAVALSIGNNNANTTYSGVLSGIGSLAKIGNGTLVLTGSDTYSGPTAVNQGRLVVNGSLLSPVTVGAPSGSGGTLGGTGSLTNVTVSASGHLAPGNSPGVLHLSGSLSLLAGAVLDYELGTPITTSDEVSMPSGFLVLNGQQFSDFNFTPLAGFGRGTYTLIDALSISGSLGPISSGTVGGYPANLGIQGGDLVLNVVPEPGTIGILAIAAFGLLCWGLRKQFGRSRGAMTIVLAAATSLLLPCARSFAANHTWAVSTGEWSLASNWGGTLPNAADYAYVVNGGTVTVATSGAVCGALSLGSSVSSGTVWMTGGSFIAAGGGQYVGDSGTGRFAQSGGTNSGLQVYIGASAGSDGEYDLTGNSLLSAHVEVIGLNGSGIFTQSGGTNSLSGDITVGASGNGSYSLSGSGLLFAPDTLTLGDRGGSGTFSLSGSGRLSARGEVIGGSSAGTFTQSGGTNTCTYLIIGEAITQGTYNLNGGLLTLISPDLRGSRARSISTAARFRLADHFLSPFPSPSGRAGAARPSIRPAAP